MSICTKNIKGIKGIFSVEKPIIGMIHVQPLPGTPKYQGSMDKIIDSALAEVELYKKIGIDSIMIENMHDTPYLNSSVGPEITSAMTVVASKIKEASQLACGIQILAAANKEALAVALSANLDYIRAEGMVFAHVGDEGMIQSCAGELLRYRKLLEAENIAIFADIKKKHSSHAITSDIDIAHTAQAAEFFLCDGVIVTGESTGYSADVNEVKRCKEVIKTPVFIGSGADLDNIESYLKYADGVIAGSYFKKDGYWENKIDLGKSKKFMDKVRQIRA